jgi:hypothetical protein
LLQFQSPPLARILTSLDVIEDSGPGFGSGPVGLSIHPLTFEYAKETRPLPFKL